MKNGGRALVVHQGALGDFLLMLPVIEALHDAYPRVRIDFWSRLGYAALIAHRSYFGQAHSSNGSEIAPFYHEELWRESPLPALFAESDEIIIFGQEAARAAAERIALKSNCPVHWVRSFPTSGEDVPVSRFILQQFRAMGFPIEEKRVRMLPIPEEKIWVESWLAKRGWQENRPVLMHPGSGGIGKIWPLKHWWALINWLHEKSRRPILMTLGPADDPLRHFASEAERMGVAILDGLSLARLAALLAESRCYVGCDSGVSHLASMMGVPSLVVFGPTEPSVWGPQGSNVSIFRDRWHESEVLAWSTSDVPAEPEPNACKGLEAYLST